jgi:hypothetical protein
VRALVLSLWGTVIDKHAWNERASLFFPRQC